MELIYIGGHDAVDVPLPDGREVRVANGESFDFPDAHAARLLEQPSNWQPAKPLLPLDERIAKAKTNADVDAIADELGVTFDNNTPVKAKKQQLEQHLAELAVSEADAGDAGEEQ